MKAFVKTSYGGPEVLRFEEVEKPGVEPGHLLVKIRANSANPADWHVLRGTPVLARFAFGLFKPRMKIPGSDFSGIVEETGDDVTTFKPGDRVFGEALRTGVCAEFACVPARGCAIMPEGVDFSEMACMPIAGLTAWQELTTQGKLKKGETVLINGASGGVGHLAVQIARYLGARVTGVCSRRNREFVTSLGAEKVIAYDEENIHQHPGNYDLVVDNHGNLNVQDFRRMGQRGVMVGFTTLAHMLKTTVKGSLSKFQLTSFTAEAKTEDLEILASLVQKKAIKVHIDRTYSHHQIPEAIGYIEKMHTRGKVAMVWD